MPRDPGGRAFPIATLHMQVNPTPPPRPEAGSTRSVSTIGPRDYRGRNPMVGPTDPSTTDPKGCESDISPAVVSRRDGDRSPPTHRQRIEDQRVALSVFSAASSKNLPCCRLNAMSISPRRATPLPATTPSGGFPASVRPCGVRAAARLRLHRRAISAAAGAVWRRGVLLSRSRWNPVTANAVMTTRATGVT